MYFSQALSTKINKMTDNFLMTFVTSKYLTDNDKANVANSSKIGKTDIMNHTAWKDRHANAVNKLLKFLESHYDLNGSGGTYSIMHIKTWSNPLLDTSKDTLDILERTVVRNIIRRHVPKHELIETLYDFDEPDDQFNLVQNLLERDGYLGDDLTDLCLLNDMSCYANCVRHKVLNMYDSILLNPESSDLYKIDHIFIDELRREAKPYYTLFR